MTIEAPEREVARVAFYNDPKVRSVVYQVALTAIVVLLAYAAADISVTGSIPQEQNPMYGGKPPYDKETAVYVIGNKMVYLPDGTQLDIPNRDHNPAVGDKVFKQGALDFLKARP